MSFKPLSPGKMISHKNIIAPDTTSGPLELAKRMVYANPQNATAGSGLPYDLPPDVTQTDIGALVAPFYGMAGTLNYRVFFGPDHLDTAIGIIYRDPNLPSVLPVAAGGGMLVQPLAQNRTMCVARPYLNTDLWYPTVPNSDEFVATDLPLVVTTLGAAPSSKVCYPFMAVGDDFAVYHAVTPPFLVTAEAIARRKAQLAKADAPSFSASRETVRANPATLQGKSSYH